MEKLIGQKTIHCDTYMCRLHGHCIVRVGRQLPAKMISYKIASSFSSEFKEGISASGSEDGIVVLIQNVSGGSSRCS